jgi:hypothetical protein
MAMAKRGDHKDEMIRVLVLHTDGRAEFEVLPHTLEQLQSKVGGYLEPISIEPWGGRGLMALVNEDGQRLKLPPNPFSHTLLADAFGMRTIVGDALIVHTRGDEFDSLSNTDVSALRLQLSSDGVPVAS